MAVVNEEEKADQVKNQERNTELRRDLQNVYASLLGEQTAKSFAAFTFEEALDAQIERICGGTSECPGGSSTQTRPNELDRVSRIENRAVQAIEKLKILRPEEFIPPDQGDDVNPPLEPDDE